MALDIDKKLYNEIKEYCKINNLRIGIFINEILRKGFYIEKYGLSPFSNSSGNGVDVQTEVPKSTLNNEDTIDKKEEKNKTEKTILQIQEENIMPINKSKKRKLK